MGEREVYTGFWWGKLMDRDQSEDPGANGNVILKWVFKNWHGKAWSGLVWLTIGTAGEQL